MSSADIQEPVYISPQPNRSQTSKARTGLFQKPPLCRMLLIEQQINVQASQLISVEHKSPLHNRASQSNEKSKQMFQLSVCLLKPLRQLDGLFYVFSSIGLITSYYDEYFLFCTISSWKNSRMLYILSLFSQVLNRELILNDWVSFQYEIFVDFFERKNQNQLKGRGLISPRGLISEVTVKLQMERITISTPKPLPVFL